ncbi:condensation domain-containing protein [Allorhizocola rhizosphaerae]|uniref:condensation domain-containing protein n=1 Tax=Allorhizocola rhizosphaerae TaxID=1872709 RepID=UPI0013C33B4F|nr:condensation domain-containing protein [Allorhizocola rhizosphaerae]
MIEPADRIVVAFSGEGSGIEELTWGQRAIWNAMTEQQTSLPIGGWLPLPEGTTVQHLAAELRFHMSRHQSMRMRLVFDENGKARQSVTASGEIVLEVFDARDADPAEVAEQVKKQYMDAPFDYAGEWPVRMAVIRRAGAATHVVSILCHLVTDAAGGVAMMADLSNLDRETGAVLAPVTAMQPLDLARWQQTPAGQRQHASSLQYWEEQLRGVPSYRYAESTDKREPRHWEGQLFSPAVHLAAHALAHRLQAASSQVLLAAYATMLVRLRGVDPIVIRPVVSNRFRPGLADIVSPINEAGLCVIPVEGAAFDEVVRRTRRTVIRAFKAAYYHPEALDELIAVIAKDRGEELDLDCFFNDRRPGGGSAETAIPTAAQIREAQQHSVFRWTLQQDKPFGRLFLHIDDFAGPPEAVTLTIRADTHHVPPADMQACLQGIESLLVEAAETYGQLK